MLSRSHAIGCVTMSARLATNKNKNLKQGFLQHNIQYGAVLLESLGEGQIHHLKYISRKTCTSIRKQYLRPEFHLGLPIQHLMTKAISI